MLMTNGGEHIADMGKKHTNKTISMQLKRKMVAEVGVTALYIYDHYSQYYNVKGYVLSDIAVSKSLGLSEQIVKRNRLKLVDANYFFEIRTTGKDVVNYYYAIGRETVMRVKFYDKVFDEQTACRVRSKYSPDEALAAIEKADIRPMDRIDIFDSLVPKKSDRDKASAEWRKY